MIVKKQLIQFFIENQTDCQYNLEMFVNNEYSINATTKYSWDITSETVSCGTATIVINGQTLTITFDSTLAGLLNSLNQLGYGFFCTETIGGSTFLFVSDDTNVYGNLTLCPTGASTTTTTTTTTSSTSTTTTLPPTSTTTTSSTTSSTTLPGSSTTTTSTSTTTTLPPTSTTTSSTSTTTTLPPTSTTTSTSSTSTSTSSSSTSTSSTSSTTTTIVGFSYDVSQTSSVDAPTACSFSGTTQTLFAATNNPLLVTRFFTDAGCTVPYSGDTNFYRYQLTSGGGSYSGQIDLGGFVTNTANCP